MVMIAQVSHMALRSLFASLIAMVTIHYMLRNNKVIHAQFSLLSAKTSTLDSRCKIFLKKIMIWVSIYILGNCQSLKLYCCSTNKIIHLIFIYSKL